VARNSLGSFLDKNTTIYKETEGELRNQSGLIAILLTALVVLPLAAQAPSQSDLSAIYQIKDEGFNHSQVMDTLGYLTDVYGPRLTNSPDIRQAAEWTTNKMKEWQLSNVHLEPWGPFGRGWSNERFSAQVISPRPFPLIAYSKAWTPGTNGPVTAEAVWALIQKEEDIEKYRGKLKGKFVLTAPLPEVPARFEAQGHRYTDAELADIATQPVPAAQNVDERIARLRALRELNLKIQKFLVDEGVAAWLEPSQGDDGTVFVQSGGGRDAKDPPAPPRVAVASENYGRIARMLDKKVPVTLQIDIQNKFYDDDLNSFNIIGEIPGADKAKADEIVMVGGHFDSWHAGTGATDNGAGSAVMLEAMRILKTTGVKMRRTVRIGLWTGEEEGLLGSRAYVKQHFADWEPDREPDKEKIKILSEHAKLDAYYNVDNGSGKIRGIYLQGNESVAALFTQWMEPFHNVGMTTLSIRNTGGTDHLSFNEAGLPGFQFIQDPIEYETRTHHSNMDVYERIQEPDMKQMAVIVASFVFLTANRDEMVPRKPLPKPRPKRTDR
jgi:carboxypeptidase Q